MPAEDAHRRLNLVLAWPYQEWGGAQTHLLTLADCLHGQGHVVRALVPINPAAALRRLSAENGVELVEFGPPVMSGPAASIVGKVARRWSDLRCQVALVRTARRMTPRPDVFHVDLPPWNSVLAVLGLLRIAPAVQTFHTPMMPPSSRVRDRLLRARYRFLATRPQYRLHSATQATADSLAPWVGPVPIDITGVCDFSAVSGLLSRSRTDVRADFGFNENDLVIGTLGQIIHRKGIDVLLRAASVLKQRSIDVRILLGGSGDASAAVVALAAALDLSDRVTIVHPDQLGESHSDHLRVLYACDVVVMPSREEGLPLALLEALGLGRPCVVTPVGAIPTVFEEQVHLRYVGVDKIEETADVIADLLAAPARAQAMGARGAAKVQECFDPEVAAQIHLGVVRELVAKRSR
jgi:glycosyltransferase involved in cell wall biosynthesis